jgi:hypothetical protein
MTVYCPYRPYNYYMYVYVAVSEFSDLSYSLSHTRRYGYIQLWNLKMLAASLLFERCHAGGNHGTDRRSRKMTNESRQDKDYWQMYWHGQSRLQRVCVINVIWPVQLQLQGNYLLRHSHIICHLCTSWYINALSYTITYASILDSSLMAHPYFHLRRNIHTYVRMCIHTYVYICILTRKSAVTKFHWFLHELLWTKIGRYWAKIAQAGAISCRKHSAQITIHRKINLVQSVYV